MAGQVSAGSPVEIPALPGTHSRALALVADDGVQMGELAAVVESDPSLTLAVLRVANSAAAAGHTRYTVARDAIIRIGLASTRRLIAATAVSNAFPNLESSGLDVDAIWEHSLAIAVLSEAAATDRRKKSIAFSAGLLHDVGRLVMANRHPDRYARVVRAAARGTDTRRAEELLFGMDHAAVGARVANAWELDAEITHAIRDHHHADAAELAAAVHQARRIARAQDMPDGVLAPDRVPARTAADEAEEAADADVLKRVGGKHGLDQRITWYRGAMAQAA